MAGRAAGRIIADRYALKAPLGRGGMGVVWRARDGVLGREVAVKEVVFPPAMADDERRPAQARVLREARAAARLNHPGAVTLYDVVRDQAAKLEGQGLHEHGHENFASHRQRRNAHGSRPALPDQW